MVSTLMSTELSTKDTGRMTFKMDGVLRPGLTNLDTKVTTRKVRNTAKELTSGAMGLSM